MKIGINITDHPSEEDVLGRMELVLEKGLEEMSDLHPGLSTTPLGFSLTMAIKKHVLGGYMCFCATEQYMASMYGRVEPSSFMINIVRNAQPADASSSVNTIDQHYQGVIQSNGVKQGTGAWCILNFAFNKPLVLPACADHHDRIYTFVLQQNALYQGSQVIKCPAVKGLPFNHANYCRYLPLGFRTAQRAI